MCTTAADPARSWGWFSLLDGRDSSHVSKDDVHFFKSSLAVDCDRIDAECTVAVGCKDCRIDVR
jgi:hypothetical protein